jgi:adenylate cyclase
LGSTVQRSKVPYGFSKGKRKSVPCKIRIDIHSGRLIAATSGIAFDIWGDAINIASHIESTSKSVEIHISEKTRDYLEGLGQLTSRGEISLRGKGVWSTFFLESFNS